MGIDSTSFEAIIRSMDYLTSRDNALTLGRQGIHIPLRQMKYMLNKYKYADNFYEDYDEYCEKLFKKFGFLNVDSLDYSSYENANIIHDMNKSIEVDRKYDYIYDGGTIEHIFNMPQVLENVINLLNVGGIFCSVTCNNNFSGHGIYQFSPEFFLSTFTPKYGMEIKEIYIARINSEYVEWINVNSHMGWRNNSKINTQEEVYIITIAKKIMEDRKSLIEFPPQQYSYENVDWNIKN